MEYVFNKKNFEEKRDDSYSPEMTSIDKELQTYYTTGKNQFDLLEEYKKNSTEIIDFLIKDFNLSEYKRKLEEKVGIFLTLLFDDHYEEDIFHKKIFLEKYLPYDLQNKICCITISMLYGLSDIFYDTATLLSLIGAQSKITKTRYTDTEIRNRLQKYNLITNSKYFNSHYIDKHNNSKTYDNLANIIKKDTKIMTEEEQFIYAEYLAYTDELRSLDTSAPKYCRWISRYDGDSEHFDILSYDKIKQREKVMEVKSSSKTIAINCPPNDEYCFFISEREFNMIPIFMNYAEYQLIYYTFYNNYSAFSQKSTFRKDILSFDINNGFFVDQERKIYKYINTCTEENSPTKSYVFKKM